MTDQEINIAIAEACGWHNITPCKCSQKLPRGWHPSFPDGSKHLPSYTTDLNAMHQAEKMLTPNQCWQMGYELEKCCGVAAGIGSGEVHEYTWHATARQRAEAFLKTIGKWKEKVSSP